MRGKFQPEWRLLRSWSDRELETRLRALETRKRSFDLSPEGMPHGSGWTSHYSEALIAKEPSGPPSQAFQRMRDAIARYKFSDPRIVLGHFFPETPLLGRRILLEIQVLGFHYLCPTLVCEVLDHQEPARTRFGFRYDTLQGHIESGSEWFVAEKNHHTGEITFRIEAWWRAGDFPNWWSEMGFKLLVRRYQDLWHRAAYRRLRALAGPNVRELPPLPQPGHLIHAGPRKIRASKPRNYKGA